LQNAANDGSEPLVTVPSLSYSQSQHRILCRGRPLPDLHLFTKLCTIVFQSSHCCIVKRITDRLSELQVTLPTFASADILTVIQ
jgi:hypothetical protein